MLKLDLEKAFDRLKWSFVYQTLLFFKFPCKITTLIMNCISTSNISALVDGTQADYFTLSRGNRQGDPMSPYIFILCMDLLSNYMTHLVDFLNWEPIFLRKNSPQLFHLFFADDLTLISKVSSRSIQTMFGCMNYFCNFSGQKINSSKSKAIFSVLCSNDIKKTCYRYFQYLFLKKL